MQTSKAQSDQPTHPRSLISSFNVRSEESIVDKLATCNITAFYWTNHCNWVGWFEPCMVGNPGLLVEVQIISVIQFHSFKLTYCFFFLLIINVSSDKVCFKHFEFTYIWASWACVITINEPVHEISNNVVCATSKAWSEPLLVAWEVYDC